MNNMLSSRHPLFLSIACILSAPFTCAAQTSEDAAALDSVFVLGKITVKGQPTDTPGDGVVSQQEMWRLDTPTLDAAVKLIPGVTATQDTNGRRNEHDIFVRGFGRLQVPLLIDGIRVYLPADNRLDYRRFLTADLAEIQISKGQASVIDGPGALGGVINLVTRKPAQPFEARLQLGVDFDRTGGYDGPTASASLGTRQARYYAQASASLRDIDAWKLPSSYQGTSIQPAGDRLRSASRDAGINLKVGITPNARDEYSLSYTRQQGAKGAPLNVYNDPPNPPNSYWDWPEWDIANLYFLSNTSIGDRGWIKTKLYRNTFDNVLDAYDDASYSSQSNKGRFHSVYGDTSNGISLEAGLRASERSETRAALHWRSDRHSEYNINRPTSPTFRSQEPTQRSREDTLALALETTWYPTPTLDLTIGVARERNRVKQAQDYSATRGLFEYPSGGSAAWNGQMAAHWQASAASRLGVSLSSRTRFPTLFERFSTRFGTAIPNPDLGTERATNIELSWQYAPSDDTHLEAALFHSRIAGMIQTVIVDAGPPQMTQTQNVGNGEIHGIELGGQMQLSGQLVVGGNATWLHRGIRDPLQPGIRPIGTPGTQALLYATWQPVEKITITPSVDFADDRWSDGPGGSYLRTGRYTNVNLQMEWKATESLRLAVGGKNLADDRYELAWGFPEPGRSFYVKGQLAF